MGNGEGSAAGGGGAWSRAVDFSALPEGCIAHVLSFTSPQDVCRLSLVSSAFRSAAESDVLWERFLPSEYNVEISDALSGIVPPTASKKEVYLYLCDNPILIDGGTKSFSLDKRSGKKCFMLSPRDLFIVWGDTPTYWRWTSPPEARFAEAAELLHVCWLELRGKINTSMLSPATPYAAHLVFKTNPSTYGFQCQPVQAAVGLVGAEISKQTVYLEAETEWQRQQHQYFPIVRRSIGLFNFGRRRIIGTQEPVPLPREVVRTEEDCRGPGPVERGDGWSEIELGEFFYDGVAEGELEMSVLEVEGGNWKSGLLVQGIEIRPKVLKSK